MHFAAFAAVGESVADPAKYYQNNVVASLALLEAMRGAGVKRIVFSSTTATYGVPEAFPITEDEPQQPINPYGFAKLVIEHGAGRLRRGLWPGYAALRYFNAAGASPDGDLGEDHDAGIAPDSDRAASRAGAAARRSRSSATITPRPTAPAFATTSTSTTWATAHVSALERLDARPGLALNLGTGRGHSVREVIDACRRVTGHADPQRRWAAPRPGDPPELVADSRRAQRDLDWQPRIPISTRSSTPPGVGTRRTPRGYADR